MRIFFTILFTAIFCFIVLLPVFFSIKNRWSENKKNEKIETESPIEKRPLFLLDERSLQSQPMFWTVIALPLVVGAILWAFVAYQYEWELSVSAYSSFMKSAQFPFVIIALSPILGAFVMYGHRSLQTFTQINATNKQIETAKSQLEEAQKKNKVDIYFTIKKNIIDQLDSLVNKYSNEKNNSYLIYKRFYTQNNHYEISLNEMNIDAIETEINIANSYLKSFSYQFDELTTEGSIQMNSDNINDLYSFNNAVKSVIELFGFVVSDDKLFMANISEFEIIFTSESDCAVIKEVSDDENSDISFSYVKLMMAIFSELSSIVLFIEEVLAIIFPDEDASDVISNLFYLAHPE